MQHTTSRAHATAATMARVRGVASPDMSCLRENGGGARAVTAVALHVPRDGEMAMGHQSSGRLPSGPQLPVCMRYMYSSTDSEGDTYWGM